MSTLKVLLTAGFVALLALATSCSSDDEGAGNGNVPGPGGEPAPGPGGGGESGPGTTPGAATFPAYVQGLIETQTNATAQPEPESAWGSMPDDEGYVPPPAMFQ